MYTCIEQFSAFSLSQNTYTRVHVNFSIYVYISTEQPLVFSLCLKKTNLSMSMSEFTCTRVLYINNSLRGCRERREIACAARDECSTTCAATYASHRCSQFYSLSYVSRTINTPLAFLKQRPDRNSPNHLSSSCAASLKSPTRTQAKRFRAHNLLNRLSPF